MILQLGLVVFWLHCDFVPLGSTAWLNRLTELNTFNALNLFHSLFLLFLVWHRLGRENLAVILRGSIVLIVDVRVTRWRQ